MSDYVNKYSPNARSFIGPPVLPFVCGWTAYSKERSSYLSNPLVNSVGN